MSSIRDPRLPALGIDAGSRTIKMVLFDGRGMCASMVVENGYDALERCRGLLDAHPHSAALATGYGRTLLELHLQLPTISEIKAFAVGVALDHPGPKTILDIGGQDTKIIRINREGKVAKFEMNDRCAAGTGKFFEVMARSLGYTLEEFASIPLSDGPVPALSSMCTVFAESEVTTLLARGERREAVALAIHASIIQRLKSRIVAMHEEGPLLFCGGCALNPLLGRLLERETGLPVVVPSKPQLMGALGAAITAYH